jgi:hypothetical protein
MGKIEDFKKKMEKELQKEQEKEKELKEESKKTLKSAKKNKDTHKPRKPKQKSCQISIDKYRRKIEGEIAISLKNKGELRKIIMENLKNTPLLPEIDYNKIIAFLMTKSDRDSLYGALKRRLIPKNKKQNVRKGSYVFPMIEMVNEEYEKIKSDSEKYNIERMINLILNAVTEYLISKLDE